MKLIILPILATLALASSASALQISPGDEIHSGPETSTSSILSTISGTHGIRLGTLFYKAESDSPVVEQGPLASSYTTTFTNTPSDPSDADITFDGGLSIGGQAYMLVKDGNHNPGWYLFDLTALGWDGTSTLDLNNFWPAGGAISHVAIYGEHTVPDAGATVALLGMSLLGMVGFRKALKRKS